MTLITTKRVAVSAVGLLLTFGQGLPVALAEGVKTENFCNRITTDSSNVSTEVMKREGEYEKHRSEKDAKILKSEQDTDKHLSDVRNKEDATRAAEFAKVEALAKTDAQKAAVSAFKTAVTAAISTRRAAVDKTLVTFRTGIASAHNARRVSMDAAVKTFKTSVDAAVNKAKSACAAGADQKTVRATMVAELSAAKAKLEADRKVIDAHNTVAALVSAKKKALDDAMKTFHTSMEAARQTLKTALE